MENKILALAKFLNVNSDEIEMDMTNFSEFIHDDNYYLVLTNEEANYYYGIELEREFEMALEQSDIKECEYDQYIEYLKSFKDRTILSTNETEEVN